MSMNVNPYSQIGRTSVVSWGTKQAGENNDCYWNIAKNSLPEGASNSEIAAVMNEIMELNAQKTSSGYDSMLHAGDEVLMPIKQSIEAATTAIQEATASYNEIASSYSSASSALGELNDNVKAAYEQFKNADISSDDAKELYNNYIEALKKQQTAKEEFAQIEEQLKAQEQNIEDLKTALNDLNDEYTKKDASQKEELEALKAQIDSIDSQIREKQAQVEELKSQNPKAQAENDLQTAIDEGYASVGGGF